MLAHVLYNVLYSDINGVFDDSLVKIANYVLNDAELLEEFAPGIEHLVREHVLLAVDPEVREAFLRRVENLSQVA